MTLPARLLWGIKLHENVLEVMHFDVCFDKCWYRKLSFSYRNNDIIAVQVTTTSFSGEVILYYLSNIIYTKGIVLIAMYNYIA